MALAVKNLPANAGDTEKRSFIDLSSFVGTNFFFGGLWRQGQLEREVNTKSEDVDSVQVLLLSVCDLG